MSVFFINESNVLWVGAGNTAYFRCLGRVAKAAGNIDITNTNTQKKNQNKKPMHLYSTKCVIIS